jgi:nucleotidyltransferase substrate binding protein (TIGR01987 family)
MSTEEIRWKQRFNNYNKALSKLEEAVIKIRTDYKIDEAGSIFEDKFLDDIIKEGLIQRFEYTHELAWNVMKDFLENAGNTNIFGSKDATREAFSAGLIHNGELWMDMINSRNKTTHTYNQETADAIYNKIINQYYDEFTLFRSRMSAIENN